MSVPLIDIPELPPAGRPFTARRAFFILCAYFVTQLLAAIVVSLVASGYYASRIRDPQQLAARVEAISTLPAVILGFLVGAWVVCRMTRRSFAGQPRAEVFRSLGVFRGSARDLSGGAGLGIALALLYVIVLSLLPPISPDQTWGPLVTAASTPGWQRHLWALVAVVLAPPIEEFLFRGVLFLGFTNSFGPVWAAIAVTTIFTLFHVPEIRSYWPAIAGVAVVATVTILIRLKTRSIGPTVALHAAYNFALVCCVYLGVA